MKTSIDGACAAKVLTAANWAAAFGAVLALAGCQKAPEVQTPPSAAKASAVVTERPASSDPLAAARNPATATPAEAQAAEDVADNARSDALAPQLAAHPDWLARQEAICGPGNASMQARYATRQGPPDAELRDLKVACIAKDIARQLMNDAQARKAGVNDTGSL